VAPISKLSNVNADHTGFSHGAFSSNNPSVRGFGDRHNRRANIPSINTGPVGHNPNDLTATGSAFDMNFTPLLPSRNAVSICIPAVCQFWWLSTGFHSCRQCPESAWQPDAGAATCPLSPALPWPDVARRVWALPIPGRTPVTHWWVPGLRKCSFCGAKCLRTRQFRDDVGDEPNCVPWEHPRGDLRGRNPESRP
jgi:hypothetical protein